MRIPHINHIAKFQSFGIPVISGVERGTSIRRGRPADDYGVLKAGSANRRAGASGGFGGFAQGNQFRTFDNSFGFFSDGNADANAVGTSIGPDTAIAVGEKGDFKFAHPQADIQGLAKTIQQIQDWVRINHGLQPKFAEGGSSQPESGFSRMMSKVGVLEENIRRQKLFREREQQLFDTVTKLWNAHYEEGGMQFSDEATLEITYVEPQFPVDPLTKTNVLEAERSIIESGDKRAIKQLYKHMSEDQIDDLLEKHHQDRLEQMKRETEIMTIEATAMKKLGLDYSSSKQEGGFKASVAAGGADKAVSKQDNKAKQSVDSSKQKKKTGDPRPQPKEERAKKPQGKTKK